jgi:hypothetical protein
MKATGCLISVIRLGVPAYPQKEAFVALGSLFDWRGLPAETDGMTLTRAIFPGCSGRLPARGGGGSFEQVSR